MSKSRPISYDDEWNNLGLVLGEMNQGITVFERGAGGCATRKSWFVMLLKRLPSVNKSLTIVAVPSESLGGLSNFVNGFCSRATLP